MKIKVQQSLQGISKLSRSEPDPVDDGDHGQVVGATHSADALETGHDSHDVESDFKAQDSQRIASARQGQDPDQQNFLKS